MAIGEISEEDRQFLEGFTETQFLSLNSTQLKTVANLPKMEKLERLELSDNKIGAGVPADLTVIAELYPNLRVLKISNNQIKTLEEVKGLAACQHLESLDVSQNPVAALEDYAQQVRALLPKLDVLDSFNKAGDEVVSEEDESEEEEEDGEDDEEDDEEREDEDDEEGEDEEGEEDEAGPDDEEDDEDEQAQEGEQGVGSKRKAQANGAASTESDVADAAKKRVNIDNQS